MRCQWPLCFFLILLFVPGLPAVSTGGNNGYGGDNISTFYYGLGDILGLVSSGVLNNSGLDIYLGEHELTAIFPSAGQEKIIPYSKQLIPSFAFDKLSNIIGTEPNIPFVDILLHSLTVNGGTNEISFVTRPLVTLEGIPGFLALQDVTFALRILVQFDVNAISDRFLLNGLSATGSWSVGSAGFDFKIAKTGADFFCEASPRNGTLEVGRFVQLLGTSLLPGGDLANAVSNSGLDGLTLKETKLVGQYSSGEGFAFALSGIPSLDGWGSLSHSHVLITRYTGADKRTVVTLGIEVQSFRLSDLIMTLSGLDIHDVPLLGSLILPKIGLVVSTYDLTPNLLPNTMNGILANINSIQKGVTLVGDFNLVSGQSPQTFFMYLSGRGIDFIFDNSGNSLTLLDLVSVIMTDFATEDLNLPPGVSELLTLQVSRFSVIIRPKSLVVELKGKNSFNIIPGYVSILEPRLVINMTFAKPRKSRVTVTGSWMIGSEEIGIFIEPYGGSNAPSGSSQSQKGRGFVLRGSGSDINVGEIINRFHVSFLPDDLSSILTNAGIINFKIVDPEFIIPVGVPGAGLTMQLSGTPKIANWSGVTLAAALSKTGGKSLFVAGFEFKQTKFSDLIKTERCKLALTPRQISQMRSCYFSC